MMRVYSALFIMQLRLLKKFFVTNKRSQITNQMQHGIDSKLVLQWCVASCGSNKVWEDIPVVDDIESKTKAHEELCKPEIRYGFKRKK